MKIAVEQIRRQIPSEEFDYQALLHCLKDYARPRDRISDLIKSSAIVRVKKGLYVFGPHYSRVPYSRELLANLVYGPSYVSLDYALGYYAMIPERVETVTSVTLDWKEGQTLTGERLLGLLEETIAVVDLGKARQEVEPFVSNTDALAVWSKAFFTDISKRIDFV